MLELATGGAVLRSFLLLLLLLRLHRTPFDILFEPLLLDSVWTFAYRREPDGLQLSFLDCIADRPVTREVQDLSNLGNREEESVREVFPLCDLRLITHRIGSGRRLSSAILAEGRPIRIFARNPDVDQ